MIDFPELQDTACGMDIVTYVYICFLKFHGCRTSCVNGPHLLPSYHKKQRM